MSQVKTLPITATRWLSLFLCAITAAIIAVFLSKLGFVQKAYSSLGVVLNANPVLHYSSAFLAGIGIKLLLDKFYISHPKRSIGFNWRYPPVTMAVLVSLLLTAFYMLSAAAKFDENALYAQSFMSLKYLALTFIGMLITIIYQTKFYTKKPIFTAVLVALSLIYIVFAISLGNITPAFNVFMYLAASYFILAAYLLFDEYRQSKQPSITIENEDVTIQVSPELNSLKDFRKWFADDRAVEHKNDLEPDLQVYAARIYNRLLKGGDEYQKQPLAQHMALCGSFGCGKSSIVNAIANDLKTFPEEDVVWIHSDISTWGAASGSVAHVILSNIIDDISQHIDMCAFRALPKHYTEALKSGGSAFQFASTLLTGPVDIEGRFQKLNDVLKTTNHKLLITLQDVDRGTGDENEKRLNDIAALLNRLKDRDLSHINFIVAMGNENEVAAEVISKATDYREDISQINTCQVIRNYILYALSKSIDKGNLVFLSDVIPTHKLDKVENLYKVYVFNEKEKIQSDVIEKRSNLFINELDCLSSMISSMRELKKILRRVEQAWKPKKLMGEVNLLSVLMIFTLREVKPAYYMAFENNYNLIIRNSTGNLTPIINKLIKENDTEYFDFFVVLLGLIEIEHTEEKHLTFNEYILGTQTLGCLDPLVDYFQRVKNESILDNELSEQDVIKLFTSELNIIDITKKLLCDERFLNIIYRFKGILFGTNKLFIAEESTEKLFKNLLLELKHDLSWKNPSWQFNQVFCQIALQLLNKTNLSSTILETANLKEPLLLLALLEVVLENAKAKSSIIRGQNFSEISGMLMKCKLFSEHLIKLALLNSCSKGNFSDKVDYYFIISLFIDKVDADSLRLLLSVLTSGLHDNGIYIESDVLKVTHEDREKIVANLEKIDKGDIRDSDYTNVLRLLRQ